MNVAGAPRPRVLVADDEDATLELMADLLRLGGFEVFLAHDGLEALMRAHDSPPDLALLDVMMPGMDGREVCRRMSIDPALAHVPVILHSSAEESDIDWRGCGADAFVQKPFGIRELPEIARRYLGARDVAQQRVRTLTDDEVRVLAAEIRQAVRTSPVAWQEDVLSPRRELSAADEARVESALFELLSSPREERVDREPPGPDVHERTDDER